MRCRFNPWDKKIPWRGKWQPTPLLLPGKSHGRRSLVGYSPWDHKESDMTERLHFTSVYLGGFPGISAGKESACKQETLVGFLGQEDPLEREMATHSSILVWRIPWPEEPGRLHSMGLQRVGHT